MSFDCATSKTHCASSWSLDTHLSSNAVTVEAGGDTDKALMSDRIVKLAALWAAVPTIGQVESVIEWQIGSADSAVEKQKRKE